MSIRDHFSVMGRFYLSIFTLFLSLAAGVGGVVYAVRISHCDGDGGRGGAIADAIALFVIFLDRSNASRFFDLIARFAPVDDQDASPVSRKDVRSIVRAEIKRYAKLLKRDARRLWWQNFFLAFATFWGTFFWGFGDLIARHWIGKCPP
jgi:hypothetical protein